MIVSSPERIVNPTSTRRSRILEHYRYAETVPGFSVSQSIGGPNGFFRVGPSAVCYGQSAGAVRPTVNGHALFDASPDVRNEGSTVVLPFDPDEVLDNLRYERYVSVSGWHAWVQESWIRDFYYSLRPILPVSMRKLLQKAYLRDWDAIRFPNWPVDRSVDYLFERLLVLAVRASGMDRLPFIWFWPDGYQACAIVTHDVETAVGRDFSEQLITIDDEYGIKSSFQIVPEERYSVPPAYLQMLRDRGCEINVHGLNHDGNLFRDRKTFLDKAKQINAYALRFGARGFRSPILYRNADWFQDLDFSYDMSVPNVARLEPQRGGCCTVMPYFLPGGLTELPITATEDYTLFHILKDYSTVLWKQQMGMIRDGHGLIHFIIHPDYVVDSHALDVYKALLQEINRLASDSDVWMTQPGAVDRWWRNRAEMNLVPDGRNWRIEGEGSEDAKVAYACLDGDRLAYEFD